MDRGLQQQKPACHRHWGGEGYRLGFLKCFLHQIRTQSGSTSLTDKVQCVRCSELMLRQTTDLPDYHRNTAYEDCGNVVFSTEDHPRCCLTTLSAFPTSAGSPMHHPRLRQPQSNRDPQDLRDIHQRNSDQLSYECQRLRPGLPDHEVACKGALRTEE
jgi:hypothetical protein